MRLFRYGFCLGCGLIVAVLVALITAQFFIRIKVQQIDYRRRPSIIPVHWQWDQGTPENCSALAAPRRLRR